MSVSTSILAATNTIANDITAYTPLAVQAVMQTEAVAANATSSNKLATALGYILVGAKAGEATGIPAVAAISSLVDLVGQLVEGFNNSGLFSHASPTAASAAGTPATSGALAGVATVQPATATPVVATEVSGTTAAPVAHESLGAHVKDFFTGKVDVKV